MEISFTFGFFAVWAVILSCTGETSSAAAAVFFLSILHESGHIAAMALTGTKIRRLTFYCGGIAIKKDGFTETDTYRELFILSAGCIINFAAALFFTAMGSMLWAYTSTGLGLFNILPFSSLDGGRMIRTLTLHFFPCADIDGAQKITDIIMLIISFALFFSGLSGAALPAAFTLLFLENIL